MSSKWLRSLLKKKKTLSPARKDQPDSDYPTGAVTQIKTASLQEAHSTHFNNPTDERSIDKEKQNYTYRESRRRTDMAAEQELASFLDSYLYKPLLEEGRFTSIKRIEEVEMQLKGVDVEATTNTRVARIDEKAQLYYINKNLPTFAFELQFLKDAQTYTGWLLNPELLTNYYLLIWPMATTDKVRDLKKDDFTELDALMISRRKIHDFLDKNGFTCDILIHTADQLRQQGRLGKVKTKRSGIYYYVSDPQKYAESPINLVIGKNHLLQLADAHYKITKNGFERLSR